MNATVKKLGKEQNYQGIAALSPDALKRTGVSPHDTILVQADENHRLCRVARAPGTSGDIVALGDETRDELNVNPGEEVKFWQKSAQNAERVCAIIPSDFEDKKQAHSTIDQHLLQRPVQAGTTITVPGRSSQFGEFKLRIVYVEPNSISKITEGTSIKFLTHLEHLLLSVSDTDEETTSESPPNSRRPGDRASEEAGKSEFEPQNEFRVTESEIQEVTFDDIGGMGDTIQDFKKYVQLPICAPDLSPYTGKFQSSGILLSGPPGTGKSLLAKALANEVDASFYQVRGSEVASKYVGESGERIRSLFEAARESSPSIILFDEFDSLGQVRNSELHDARKGMVGQLLTQLEGLDTNDDVFVVATTNNPDQIDEALRRSGRLGKTIEITPPDEDGRHDILNIHTEDVRIDEDVQLDEIASRTHGYTGADLKDLVKEAIDNAYKRARVATGFSINDLSEAAQANVVPAPVRTAIKSPSVEQNDFVAALDEVEPSSLIDHRVSFPDTTWEDIAGHEDVIEEIKDAIVRPLEHPAAFDYLDIGSRPGILLAGPPGTGKTMLGRAIATETESNFISVKGPELLNKYVGESEAGVREIFEKARETGPTILFFDEIDSLVPERTDSSSFSTEVTDRVVNQFLTELDGLDERGKVIVVGATNRRDRIDEAVLRDGRLGAPITVGLPDKAARRSLFKLNTESKPLSEEIDFDYLAEQTDGEPGSAIEAACDRAARLAFRDAYETNGQELDYESVQVEMCHFESALEGESQEIGGAGHSQPNSLRQEADD